MQRTCTSRKNAGVTLVELVIVLVIAAILAALAAPSFTDFLNNTRMTSTMTQLTGDLNRARNEAIKRNQRVLMCVRNAAGSDCGTGTDWRNGWLICYDGDQDGACDAATATTPNPIAVQQAINANFTLAGSAASIRFNPNGTGGPGTLNLASGAQSRTANIAATGNISVSNP